jgi:hypothetical protein
VARSVANAFNDSAFRNNVDVVLTVAAAGVADDPATYPTVTADTTLHGQRRAWAVRAATNTQAESAKIVKMMIGANHTAPIANIIGADLTTIETAIKDVIDFFAVNDAAA